MTSKSTFMATADERASTWQKWTWSSRPFSISMRRAWRARSVLGTERMSLVSTMVGSSCPKSRRQSCGMALRQSWMRTFSSGAGRSELAAGDVELDVVTGQGIVSHIAMDTASPPNLYWGSPISGIVPCSSSASQCNGKPTVLFPPNPALGATRGTVVAVDSTSVYVEVGALVRIAK